MISDDRVILDQDELREFLDGKLREYREGQRASDS